MEPANPPRTETEQPPKPDIYTSLDKSRGQIRLLHLLPGDVDDEICCTLEVVSLDDVPDYEALSYVWGSPTQLTHIKFDGHTFQVRKNLRRALTGIRRVYSERVVWVDALCINQDDMAERGSQVSMMGDIYSMASGVIAYIGEEFKGCDVAIETMKHVSLNKYEHFEGPDDEVLKFRGVPVVKGGINWYLIYDFFESLWATRIWTAQEYVLARCVIVYRSRQSIAASHLENFMDYLSIHTRNGCCEPREEHNIVLFDLLLYQYRSLFEPDSDTSILKLLAYYRVRKSTDVRDKVFALLGLSNETYREKIVTDYDMRDEDVFISVARTEGELSGRLDFLSYCGPRSTLFLPSWVPDWSIYDSSCIVGANSGLINRKYCADGNNPPGSFLFHDQGELMTFGIKVGKISRRIKPINDTEMDIKHIPELWEFVTEERPAATQYSENQTLRTAFWLTMSGGLDASVGTGSTARERLRPDEYESAVKMWEDEVFGGGYKDRETLMGPFFSTVSNARCFIELDSGCIGFGPRGCLIGDLVVVLSGGSLPCVVRPVDRGQRHQYHFVGDAYVHGFMYGEAFQLLEQKKARLDVFRLI